MNPTIKFFTVLSLFFGIGFTVISGAHAELVKGRDYALLLNPQPTTSGDKIEVLEFFWYGCPSCYKLHPQIKLWQKKIPKDVSLKYIPTIFRKNWTPATKTFYTLEILGDKNNLHDKIYDAIHIEKIDLSNEEILFSWIEKQGDRSEKIYKYLQLFFRCK